MEILSRIDKRVRRELFSRIYIDKGKYEDAIFIAGSGRSGTTWLADTLAQIYNYRLIFEPFWHLHLKIDGQDDFFHHRYIQKDDDIYDGVIKDIIKGNYRNYRTNYNYRPGPFGGRVIKDICSNLFLNRIKQINPSMPIIYIIRSPYAVVNSRNERKKWGRAWGDHAHLFLEQNKLMEEMEFRLEPRNEIEDHIITYCYENNLPLREYIKDQSTFLLISYEELFSNKEETLRKIVDYIERSLKINRESVVINYKDKFLMTSEQSKSRIIKDSSRVNKLSKYELESIEQILDKFGMHKIFDALNLKYDP